MKTANPTMALSTPDGEQLLVLRRADNFVKRLIGLMFAAPLKHREGLLLKRCNAVHTFFMRAPIDLLYLDAAGIVTKCVSRVKPWRFSTSRGADSKGNRFAAASDTLELAAGSIDRMRLAVGCRLFERNGKSFAENSARAATAETSSQLLGAQTSTAPARASAPARGQRGAAMIEFTVVGPIITLIGLASLQYGMLFFAKNQYNHASFMAARAGSVEHANLDAVKQAYTRALVPIYGGGTTTSELATSYAKATADVDTSTRIELLNPTKESFSDWNNTDLQRRLNTGSKRVIPNGRQASQGQKILPSSGQSIQDANLIKLRITQGYKPKVPLVSNIYAYYLAWMDTKTDAFNSSLIADGRIPIVTNVTLQMQSDAIEPDNPVSLPGAGNGGNPTDPGDPPIVTDPRPPCPPTVCASGQPPSPVEPGPGSCPAPAITTLSADTLFASGQSTLQPLGTGALDTLIANAKAQKIAFDTITVTGYTDPTGNAADNQRLSQARAETVSSYLSSHGLTASHVDVIGKGSADLVVPLSACSGKSGAAQNTCLAPDRRVVVKLTPKAPL